MLQRGLPEETAKGTKGRRAHAPNEKRGKEWKRGKPEGKQKLSVRNEKGEVRTKRMRERENE
jgi:hypothetical protein